MVFRYFSIFSCFFYSLFFTSWLLFKWSVEVSSLVVNTCCCKHTAAVPVCSTLISHTYMHIYIDSPLFCNLFFVYLHFSQRCLVCNAESRQWEVERVHKCVTALFYATTPILCLRFASVLLSSRIWVFSVCFVIPSQFFRQGSKCTLHKCTAALL